VICLARVCIYDRFSSFLCVGGPWRLVFAVVSTGRQRGLNCLDDLLRRGLRFYADRHGEETVASHVVGYRVDESTGRVHYRSADKDGSQSLAQITAAHITKA
jgi:hypothetical protein